MGLKAGKFYVISLRSFLRISGLTFGTITLSQLAGRRNFSSFSLSFSLLSFCSQRLLVIIMSASFCAAGSSVCSVFSRTSAQFHHVNRPGCGPFCQFCSVTTPCLWVNPHNHCCLIQASCLELAVWLFSPPGTGSPAAVDLPLAVV